MSIYLCHSEPDLYEHEAVVTDTRPDAVALSRSAFHPGGGGQVSDTGTIESNLGPATVTGIEIGADGTWWHLVDRPDTFSVADVVAVNVDRDHRASVAGLHTLSHVLNALVFAEFDGALVTGAQINGDGTGRMDFDLPEVDNDRLRALVGPVNATVAEGLEVNSQYVDLATAEPGLIRSLSVAPPPTDDGTVRVIEIGSIDRQACGGTHLANTGQTRPIQITKVENKGRHNRRVRFQYAP